MGYLGDWWILNTNWLNKTTTMQGNRISKENIYTFKNKFNSMMKNLTKLKLCIAFIVLSSIIVTGCKKNEDENPTGKSSTVFNTTKTYSTMTDRDGNVYKTITIGTQTWMAENLRTTTYNDDKPIPNVSDPIAWASLLSGAYCNYKDTSDVDFIATYGRLYNWYAINTGKLAPQGWHVPSKAEFTTLINFLGGDAVAGGKLKETGTTHWLSPNTEATNESGFSALPSGYRGSIDYPFQSLTIGTSFWTSTDDGTYSTGRLLLYNDSHAPIYVFGKKMGLPVRLIKDM
jgi:uncharacterized protein (TIGR02145 family)